MAGVGNCAIAIAAHRHIANLSVMKSKFLVFVFAFIALLPIPSSLRAQDTDKEVDDAIQEATESAKKMGLKMPDVKKQLDEVDKEEAKEKAALQKQKATRSARAGGASRLDSENTGVQASWPSFKEDCR